MKDEAQIAASPLYQTWKQKNEYSYPKQAAQSEQMKISSDV